MMHVCDQSICETFQWEVQWILHGETKGVTFDVLYTTWSKRKETKGSGSLLKLHCCLQGTAWKKQMFVFVVKFFAWCLSWVSAQLLTISSTSMNGENQSLKLRHYCKKRWAVVGFIKRLCALRRKKKTKNLYLPVKLKSMQNLWEIYNQQAPNDTQVKYGFFHHIFRSLIFPSEYQGQTFSLYAWKMHTKW